MENLVEDIPLGLKWRATWPDKDADYVAEASTYKGNVGMIYLIPENHGPQANTWFWSFLAFGDEVSRNIGTLTGHEPSARAAARAVESAWYLAIAGTSHELPESVEPARPPVNQYAAAKGR